MANGRNNRRGNNDNYSNPGGRDSSRCASRANSRPNSRPASPRNMRQAPVDNYSMGTSADPRGNQAFQMQKVQQMLHMQFQQQLQSQQHGSDMMHNFMATVHNKQVNKDNIGELMELKTQKPAPENLLANAKKLLIDKIQTSGEKVDGKMAKLVDKVAGTMLNMSTLLTEVGTVNRNADDTPEQAMKRLTLVYNSVVDELQVDFGRVERIIRAEDHEHRKEIARLQMIRLGGVNPTRLRVLPPIETATRVQVLPQELQFPKDFYRDLALLQAKHAPVPAAYAPVPDEENDA